MFVRLCLIVLRNNVTSPETYQHLLVIFLFVHPCWMSSLVTNFSIDLNLTMKTLILISSSSPLPHLPWAVADGMSLVPGSW